MASPQPLTVQSRPWFQLFLWGMTFICLVTGGALVLRALDWMRVVRFEPTVLALWIPVLLFFLLAYWLGRWALFHSTVTVQVTETGLAMQSAVASDTIGWEEIEAIRLQGTSGSEVQLIGNGHRVTVPSGSAAPADTTLALQGWINARVGHRDLEYVHAHFWGP